MRIALVADSHLSPAASAFNANWRAAGHYIADAAVDLTVHLGDITVDGAADVTQFEHARTISLDWPTELRFLPGNHDIGDNPPGPGVPAKQLLDIARLNDFRTQLGDDYWTLVTGPWCVISLNAQLFGTATAEEEQQWQWLAQTLAGCQGLQTVLMLHKPLFQNSPDDAAPHIRYVPLLQRRRLCDLFAGRDLKLVLCGHTHQYLDRTIDGVRHIWLPSTAFYLPDTMQDRVGEKVVGLGLLDLDADGYRFHLVCPEGMARNNILDHPVYPGIPKKPAPQPDSLSIK